MKPGTELTVAPRPVSGHGPCPVTWHGRPVDFIFFSDAMVERAAGYYGWVHVERFWFIRFVWVVR